MPCIEPFLGPAVCQLPSKVNQGISPFAVDPHLTLEVWKSPIQNLVGKHTALTWNQCPGGSCELIGPVARTLGGANFKLQTQNMKIQEKYKKKYFLGTFFGGWSNSKVLFDMVGIGIDWCIIMMWIDLVIWRGSFGCTLVLWSGKREEKCWKIRLGPNINWGSETFWLAKCPIRKDLWQGLLTNSK